MKKKKEKKGNQQVMGWRKLRWWSRIVDFPTNIMKRILLSSIQTKDNFMRKWS